CIVFRSLVEKPSAVVVGPSLPLLTKVMSPTFGKPAGKCGDPLIALPSQVSGPRPAVASRCFSAALLPQPASTVTTTRTTAALASFCTSTSCSELGARINGRQEGKKSSTCSAPAPSPTPAANRGVARSGTIAGPPSIQAAEETTLRSATRLSCLVLVASAA